MEAEFRAQRESTDARLDAHGQALERTERQFERIERQFERMAANHRAAIRWIVGTALTSGLVVAAIGGLVVALLRFGQTGG